MQKAYRVVVKQYIPADVHNCPQDFDRDLKIVGYPVKEIAARTQRVVIV